MSKEEGRKEKRATGKKEGIVRGQRKNNHGVLLGQVYRLEGPTTSIGHHPEKGGRGFRRGRTHAVTWREQDTRAVSRDNRT